MMFWIILEDRGEQKTKSVMRMLGFCCVEFNHLSTVLLHFLEQAASRSEKQWRTTVPRLGVITPWETKRLWESLFFKPSSRNKVKNSTLVVFGQGFGHTILGQNKGVMGRGYRIITWWPLSVRDRREIFLSIGHGQIFFPKMSKIWRTSSLCPCAVNW